MSLPTVWFSMQRAIYVFEDKMLSKIISAILRTPVGLWPVRVRAGLAKGARWTLGPFSANWRHGGAEVDVLASLRYLGDPRGATFWDFGAHFGIHTVGMAMQVGPGGQVVAFEPDPVAFARLSRHVQMNNLPNVTLYNAAVSAEDSQARLFLLEGGGASVSHLAFHAGHDPIGPPSKLVTTLRADTLVSAGDIRAPDIIKVDVQGHGHRALAGAAETIKTFLPVIAYSNHSWEELAGTRKLLEPLGYTPVSFEGSNISWDDVEECVLAPPKVLRRR